MGWIDADAHVVESPLTWDYLLPSEQKFRPQLFKPEGETQKAHWVIDGKIRGLFRFTFTKDDLVKKSKAIGREMTTPMETRDLENVEARVRHMDELGIDVQVVYPSIFLDQCTERADTDVALCGAYNRWLADVWKRSNGRLRWMAPLPLLSMPDALDQLKFAKENGGCGIFMRSVEGVRQINDPYFYPLYEEAERLNFCIGLHQANGSWDLVSQMANPDGSRDFFNQYRIFNVGACFRLINSEMPKKFPKLRFGFIETAASWVPWVIYEARRRMETADRKLPNDLLERYNIFVTCQIGDDVPYLIKSCMGENTLMIGTDYGHADSSAELDAL
ncbi:MAG: amidohydrolase, partial [Deltaproteobacteria bacterium]|nr:amidohydrolase [Deltaproteobacteria bacterium]